MNQLEEESLYHSLEEEAIDVDCLLVEPRSDQVSVSSVWCFEEDNLGKCIKTEDVPYKLGISDTNSNVNDVEAEKLDALDVFPHEVGVENLLSTNVVSVCDDYLLDIGCVEQGACIDFGSNEGLGNSSAESQFQAFGNSEKVSFGIQNSLTENNPGSECQNYFLGKTMCNLHHSYNCDCMFTTSSEPKTIGRFQDFSRSFIHQENNEDDDIPTHFAQNRVEVPMSSCQDHGGSAITRKRSRKPTKRYIVESSYQNLKKCNKKRRESSSSVSKVKVRCHNKHQNEMEPREKIPSSEISFGKAIQVPFIFQGPTECKETNPPITMENRIENYSTDSEGDSDTMVKSMAGGNQRKHHRLWTVSEVKKLIDGVAHFGVGKWTHIKKLLFSSSDHRTPVDLKDKWRNLLKASRALTGSRIEEDQKRSQPWRPLPNAVLCRVRELASVYPYPREGDSKTYVSTSPPRIRGKTKVSVS